VPDYLVPLVKVQMERCPEGPIFRNDNGSPFNTRSLATKIANIRAVVNRRAGREVIPKGITCYSQRHSFVTRWMQQPGADVKHLAALLGTSITQIERTYSHLFKKHETLRESAHVTDLVVAITPSKVRRNSSLTVLRL